MKKLLLALAIFGPMSVNAEPEAIGSTEDFGIGSSIVSFAPTILTENSLSGNDWKIIVAARDSAAAFLVDGDVDAQLARAIEVLDRQGLKEISLERKAVTILESTNRGN